MFVILMFPLFANKVKRFLTFAVDDKEDHIFSLSGIPSRELAKVFDGH